MEPASAASSQSMTHPPAGNVWQPTLDAARQLAARTDRLVLVYFYADWCPACRVMEEELSAAGAVAQLQQYYVPVKVNADFFPATAKQYGVTGLPTTVVITPQGQLIDGIRGRLEARQYVARLNQVASDARRAAAAQAARAWPSAGSAGVQGDSAAAGQRPVEPTRQQYGALPGYNMGPVSGPSPSQFNQQETQRPVPGGVPAADPFARSRPDVTGQASSQPAPQWERAGQPLPSHWASGSAQAVPPSAPQGTAWPTSQPATPQMSPAGGVPWSAGDNRDFGRSPQQPVAVNTSGYARSNTGNPAADQSGVSGAVTPPNSVYARWTNNWPARNETGSSQPSFQGAAGGLPIGAPAQSGTMPTGGDAVPSSAYVQPSGEQQPANVVAAAPISIPPGNPPLGLDGYCPVCLVEKQKWVLGDRAWGVIHRGRTYLFDSPEDRAKFFADPDRYAPVMSGQDVVYALESGKLVPGYRRHGVYFGNRVYLFADEASLQKFSQNPHHYADQAMAATRSASSPDNMRR